MSYIESHIAEDIILTFGYEQEDICVDYCRYKATPEALAENGDIAPILTLSPPRHYDGIGYAYPRDEFLDFVHTYLIGIDEDGGEKIYAILSRK